MIITDRYDSRELPFEGDRELVLRRLPAGARVLAARAFLTPGREVAAGEDRFTESLSFSNGTGDWGATKHVPTPTDWVEVDFHARRTLVEVSGSIPDLTTLEVDPGGGVWAEVNDRGALGGGPAFELSGSEPYPLPGLTVTRFKLTGTGANVSSVTIRSLPSNVRLSLGGAAPFWTHPGELSQTIPSPDFAAVLQAFLADAKVENGFYAVPLTLHSDTIARLEMRFEFEVVCRQSALPDGLDEVALRFDHGSVPVTRRNPLSVVVPTNAWIVATSGRATGSFTESRVAVGPTGPVEADSEMVDVSPELAQAQLLDFAEVVAADGVDLLLAAVDRTVRLELDFVEDTDGKPGGRSLLSAPVPFGLERESAGEPTWVSVALPAELQLAGTSWLALRSLEGEAQLSVRKAKAAEPSLQQSRDGGLSWRQSLAPKSEEPSVALFRLRHRPPTFRMPVEILAGEGEKAQRVSLARFDAQERVDLSLDFPEIGTAFNRYLNETARPVCSESEHLANGDFTEWIPSANDFTPLASAVALPLPGLPAEWSLTSGSISRRGLGGAFLGDFGCGAPVTALSQVVGVAGSCPYELSFSALAGAEDAVGEISWLSRYCGLLRTDPLPVRRGDVWKDPPLLHRLRVVAPPGSTQAEVRFLVPEGGVVLNGVSLRGTQEALLDADFGVSAATGELVGWQTRPEAGNGSTLRLADDGALHNVSPSEPLTLLQTVPAKASRDFELELDGRVFSLPVDAEPAAPAAAEGRLLWLRGDATPTGSVTSLAIATPGFEGRNARGTVPEDAASAQVELVLPASTGIQVRQLGLRFPESVEAPLSFIAETSGALAVRDLQVDWELVEIPPPAFPATGLCSPTPPGCQPGELADDACFCSCCGCEQKMKKTQALVTVAGRAVVAGECASCGEPLLRFGGAPLADATLLRSARPGAALRPVAVPPEPEPQADAPPEPEPPPPEPEPSPPEPKPQAAVPVPEPLPETQAAASPPLSLISGLGERRVELLAGGGIETMEHLAQADPETVRGLLPRVSQAMAADFVEQARKRLAAKRSRRRRRSRKR